jgi:hypothetical protein
MQESEEEENMEKCGIKLEPNKISKTDLMM